MTISNFIVLFNGFTILVLLVCLAYNFICFIGMTEYMKTE